MASTVWNSNDRLGKGNRPRRYAPRWLSIISHPTSASGVIVNNTLFRELKKIIAGWECARAHKTTQRAAYTYLRTSNSATQQMFQVFTEFLFASVSTQVLVLNHAYRNLSFVSSCRSNSFLFEWLSTRIWTEANCDLEMAHCSGCHSDIIISTFRWERNWKSVFFFFPDSKCIGVLRAQLAAPSTKFAYVDSAQLEENHEIQLAPAQLPFSNTRLGEPHYNLQLLEHPLQEVWSW